MKSILQILALSALPFLVLAGPPDDYSEGYATQDHEPDNQQSICTDKKCGNQFPSTAGPDHLADGVYAAAINPDMGGAPDDCAPCGSCYSIINSGDPYCRYDDKDCPVSVGNTEQHGPHEIKILITNHCPDCDKVKGHFDINQAPDGWDNPRIYYKKLNDTECF